MKIASRERVPGRTHTVGGTDYTFNPEPGTPSPMVAEVTVEAHIAVFLDQRNANMFYALDPVIQPPQRPARAPATEGGKAKGGKAAKTDTPAADAARLILDNDESTVLGLIAQMTDAAVLAELASQENAREGGARAVVMEALGAKVP